MSPLLPVRRLRPLCGLTRAAAVGLTLPWDEVTPAWHRRIRGAVAVAGSAGRLRGALLAIAALRDRLREGAAAEGVALPPGALAVDVEGAEPAAWRALPDVAVILLARLAAIDRGLGVGKGGQKDDEHARK